MIEKYLLQLIPKNNRVIVPNFGAFIISHDTGISVLFNNFLSFNDGLLINLISSQEGIEITEASTKVTEYVSYIKQQLEEKGQYNISGLGNFTRDKSGILRFEQDAHVSDLFDQEEPTSEGEDSSLLDLDNSEAEKPLTPDPEEEEEEEIAPLAKDLEDDSLLTLDADETENESSAKDQPATPIPNPIYPENASSKIKPEKKQLSSGLIALLILIPIVLIALYFILWYPSNDEKVVQKKAVPEAPQTNLAKTPDTTINAGELPPIQKKNNTETKKPTATNSPKSKAITSKMESSTTAIIPSRGYHIIVGSFKSEANAGRKMSDLKSKGFANAIKFENKGMYVVSIFTYKTLRQAQASQEQLMTQHKIESWILFRK